MLLLLIVRQTEILCFLQDFMILIPPLLFVAFVLGIYISEICRSSPFRAVLSVVNFRGYFVKSLLTSTIWPTLSQRFKLHFQPACLTIEN